MTVNTISPECLEATSDVYQLELNSSFASAGEPSAKLIVMQHLTGITEHIEIKQDKSEKN